MNIFEKAFGLKTSGELAAYAEELDREIGEADLRLVQLKTRAVSAPFDSSAAEHKALRQLIRETEEDIELLGATKEEAQKRQAIAKLGENDAAVRSRMKAGGKDQKALRDEYVVFVKLVADLAACLDRMAPLRNSLEQANAFARENGHPEMNLEHPVHMLGQQLGVQISDPVLLNQVQIRDFIPARLDAGWRSPLERMRELKL